jgi:hypothetical protein
LRVETIRIDSALTNLFADDNITVETKAKEKNIEIDLQALIKG